jgi:mevalonate kinase
MNEAAFLAREGLLEYHERAGHPALQKIAQAMKLSQACFSAWGLISAPIAAQAVALEGEGALGVKLTGAGGGGFLVALWDR